VPLSDFATFSTSISGLAVTGSVIYLTPQTHQAAKLTKALIEQGRTARMTDVYLGMCNSDFAAAALAVDGCTASPEKIGQYQVLAYYAMIVAGLEDTYGQHEEGLISDDWFRSHRGGAVAIMRQRAFRRYWESWKAARPNLLEKFKAWADEIAALTPVASMDAMLNGLFSPAAPAAGDRAD
jgi:hypothetical protein